MAVLVRAGTPLERLLLTARSLRGLVDGLISVVLAGYLAQRGLTPTQIGAIVTATLIGSAVATMLLGAVGHRVSMRSVLLGACVLMIGTGIGFASSQSFALLLLVALVGTLNPSGGDVSIFLPAEQALLAQAIDAPNRASSFARYNVCATAAAGAGALLAGAPAWIATWGGHAGVDDRIAFVLYAVIGAALFLLYRGLPNETAAIGSAGRPLARSRRTVLKLAALFSLDSFGGGFAIQSLLVFWLQRRFDLSIVAAGQLFFVAGLLGAISQLVSGRLVGRIGHIRTMVYTHLPANLFLILAGLAPRLELAVVFLLLRAAMSQMDVPARQAFVMSVVPPQERPAAASVTNVPRSLAAAFAPLLAGLLLEHSTVGWPLVVGGLIKAAYDLLLLLSFRDHAGGDNEVPSASK